MQYVQSVQSVLLPVHSDDDTVPAPANIFYWRGQLLTHAGLVLADAR